MPQHRLGRRAGTCLCRALPFSLSHPRASASRNKHHTSSLTSPTSGRAPHAPAPSPPLPHAHIHTQTLHPATINAHTRCPGPTGKRQHGVHGGGTREVAHGGPGPAGVGDLLRLHAVGGRARSLPAGTRTKHEVSQLRHACAAAVTRPQARRLRRPALAVCSRAAPRRRPLSCGPAGGPGSHVGGPGSHAGGPSSHAGGPSPPE